MGRRIGNKSIHDSVCKISHVNLWKFFVGFYRFCGDIGRGNFSRVKLAVHQLTRGKWQTQIHNVSSGQPIENRLTQSSPFLYWIIR